MASCEHCNKQLTRRQITNGNRFCSFICFGLHKRLNFWQSIDKNGPVHPVYGQCWVWTRGKNKGYGQLGAVLAHRHSWEIHHGPIPEGLYVCHHCDNPPCVNPSHLFLGTHQDNVDDKMKKGRHPGVGQPAHNKGKKGMQVAWNKGKHYSFPLKPVVCIACGITYQSKLRGTPCPDCRPMFANRYGKGKTRSPETRQKMVEAWKHRPPISAETRIRMSESQKRRYAAADLEYIAKVVPE